MRSQLMPWQMAFSRKRSLYENIFYDRTKNLTIIIMVDIFHLNVTEHEDCTFFSNGNVMMGYGLMSPLFIVQFRNDISASIWRENKGRRHGTAAFSLDKLSII